MNAPLPIKINNIELYRDVLGEDFVKETEERHHLIQRNKEESRQSTEKIKENFKSMADKFKDLGERFEQGSRSYKELNSASCRNAQLMSEVAVAAKRLAETLRKQSQQIKMNLS